MANNEAKYRQDRARESVLANLAAAPPSVKSSLLRLPRELRDEIIKMALPLSYEVGHPYKYFPVKKALPALLSVCRQLRVETAPVLLPNIAIAMRDIHLDWLLLEGFNPEYIQLVRCVHLMDSDTWVHLSRHGAVARAAELDAATNVRPGTWIIHGCSEGFVAYHNGLDQWTKAPLERFCPVDIAEFYQLTMDFCIGM
ncbi:hypothetical protein Slin14017_G119220 [Septoria linicola]|nr:hypothetical protein Slin14017_G119220 [Septoria linicola]